MWILQLFSSIQQGGQAGCCYVPGFPVWAYLPFSERARAWGEAWVLSAVLVRQQSQSNTPVAHATLNSPCLTPSPSESSSELRKEKLLIVNFGFFITNRALEGDGNMWQRNKRRIIMGIVLVPLLECLHSHIKWVHLFLVFFPPLRHRKRKRHIYRWFRTWELWFSYRSVSAY